MLPVSGEFVSVNFDKIGKSEFHDSAVAPLDCCALAVTKTAFAWMWGIRKKIQLSETQLEDKAALSPNLTLEVASKVA
jgi:hypothetical protein